MKSAFSIAALLTVLAISAGARAAVPDMGPDVLPPVLQVPAELAPEEPKFQVAQDFVPLESVLQALRDQYGGHQLSVSGPSPDGEGYVYRIKWLSEDGAVLYVTADAESGAVLSVEGE